MQTITAPLGPGDQGDAVAALQNALLLLIERGVFFQDQAAWRDERVAALQQERDAQQYGESTAVVVEHFQSSEQLAPAIQGAVDQPTADALNQRLLEQGALFRVQGQLRNPDGAPGVATLIFAYDPEYWGGAQIGEATTNADGFYRIVYDPTFYTRLGPGIDHTKAGLALVVFAFDAAGTITASSDPVADPPAELQVDLVIGELRFVPPALPPAEPPAPVVEWLVRGTLTDRDGPAGGIAVIAYDRDFGAARQRLGEAVTAVNGSFRITYIADAFLPAEGEPPPRKPAPDLVIELLRDGQLVTPEAVARVFAAGPDPVAPDDLLAGIVARVDEELQISLPAAAPPVERDEYTRLWQAILPMLPEPPAADADDAEREARVCTATLDLDEAARRDITFLAREIDWPRPLVDRFVAACRQAAQEFAAELAPAELYGLAAAGFPDIRALASASMADLDAGLRRAAAAAIIPAVDAARATLVAEIVRRIAPRILLEPAVGEARPALAQSLDLAGLAAEQQAELLRVAADFVGPPAGFWEALRENEALREHVGQVQYVMQLGGLTGQSVPLMRGIVERFPAARTLRALALQADEAQLQELVAAPEIELAPDAPGGSDAERRQRFAQGMAGVLRAADPTAAIAQVAQAISAADQPAVSPAGARLLSRMAAERPDFDLFSSPVSQFADMFVGDEAERDAAVGDVKRLQRLARISTSEVNFAGLAQTPFQFAGEIPATFTRAGFRAAHAAALGGEAEADLTYRRAVALSAATLTAAMQAHQLAADVQPYAVSAKLAAPASWAGMFGSVELCECEHCQSWFGPAAYLVDLLLFLEKRHGGAGPTPFERLRERRPDIIQLKLSCENTNTTLPLIDMVNEVLESYIVLGEQFATFGGHDVTDETAAELRAAPQHVEQVAYDRLAAAVYPISLPFARWLEVARAVLASCGAPRHALMAAFAAAPDAPVQVAHLRHCEGLGISPREHELITGLTLDGDPAEAPLAALYGLPPERPAAEVAAEVAIARAMQERTGLSFNELVDLMGCRLINPGLQIAGALQRVYESFAIDTAQLRAFVAAGQVADEALSAYLAAREQTPEQLGALLDELFPSGQVARLIIFQGKEGDPAQIEILHADGAPLDEAELRLINGFVRLWRKLGWPIAELDRALRAFGCAETILPAALDGLAELAELRGRWGSGTPELLSLWADLDTHGADSLYRRLFQSRTVGGPPDPDLALRFAGPLLTNAERPLGEKRLALARALQLPAHSLDDLIAVAGLTSDDPTSIANLSRLHRFALLSQLIELTPAELNSLRELANINPFDGPTASIAFAQLAAQLQRAGLSIAQLAYLLGQGELPADTPADATLDVLASDLAERLAAMRGQHAPPEPEALSADLLREKLLLLLDQPQATLAAELVAGSLLAPPAEERLQALRDGLIAAFPTAATLASQAAQQLTPAWKLLREGDEPAMTERQGRLAAALAAVLPLVHERLGRAIVRAAVGDGLGLDPDATALLLEVTPTLPDAGDAPFIGHLLHAEPGAAPPRAGLRALHRVALLAGALALSGAELRYMAANGERFDQLDLGNLGAGEPGVAVARWGRLAHYAALRDRLTPRRLKLLDVFLAPEGERPAALATATGWPVAALLDTLTALGLGAADLADERALATLEPVVTLARAAGAPPSALKNWAFEAPGRPQAEAIVAAARARVGEAAWLETAQAINDPLRERQRDALAAYVLTLPAIRERGIATVNQLFELFLIDVGTSACALTSRIVQASAAVQHFVQRIQLGLEPELSPDTIDAELWDWVKLYRVWEANRKIFLYPENYLLPELRDDRSPFFGELQAELSEGNLSQEQIERAVVGYLGKVEAVSRLEIVGSYRQVEAAPPLDVLHVFGRTMSGVPRSYYYRRLVDKEWTPWEPLTIEIQGVEQDEDTFYSGVHLLPVVWRGKLYLFWPQFVKKIDNEPPPEVNGQKVGVGSGLTIRPPAPYWEIKLAWSRREDGRWTPKQLSDLMLQRPLTLKTPPTPKPPAAPKKALAALSRPLDRALDSVLLTVLEIFRDQIPALQLQSVVGSDGGLTIQFIDRADGRASPGSIFFADLYAGPTGAGTSNVLANDLKAGEPHYQGQSGSGALALASAAARMPSTAILGSMPAGGWMVTALAQHDAAPLDSPVFFRDNRRLYYVELSHHGEVAALPGVGGQLKQRAAGMISTVVQAAQASEPSRDVLLLASSQLRGSSPWTQATAELVPAALSQATAQLAGLPSTLSIGLAARVSDDMINALSPALRSALTVDLGILPAATSSVRARFHTFFHPHIAAFAEQVRRGGLPALFTLENQQRGAELGSFQQRYQPVAGRVREPLPGHGVDFAPEAPYGNYNWELFYHLPMLLADELRKAGHFAAALRTIRYIFDPLDDTPGMGVERFWRVLPLRITPGRVAELFAALEPGADPQEQERVVDQLARISEHPFQPFRIARLRVGAFQKAAVMLFCDICIDAGDALFRRDTREAVGEALQYYVLAANVLGKAPEQIRRMNRVVPRSFAELRPRLNVAGNAYIEAENELLFAGVGAALPADPGVATLLSMGRTLYFCIPQNDKLLGYWATVEDRLFKIRNCMNLDGVVRELALFAPPIDPLLLARATAAGLDLGAVLADLNAPLPRRRFDIMLRQALELAAELKSTGAALLATIEKREAEHLAVLRGDHELKLMTTMRLTRAWQIAEAQAALGALAGSRDQALHRLQHFSALLGVAVPEVPEPPGPPPSPDAIAAMATVAPPMTERGRFELISPGKIMLSGAVVGAAAGGAVGGAIGAIVGAALGDALGDIELADLDTGTKILRVEQDEIWQSFLAAAYSMGSTGLDALGSVLSLIPQAEIALKPIGIGGSIHFGGHQLSAVPSFGASIMRTIGTWHGFQATLAGKQAGFIWRHQDHMLQLNSAALEIGQLNRQILAAQIRLKSAENELDVHDKQAQARQDELEFQRGKFTNEQRYAMLERSQGRLFSGAYKLAHDLARQTERAFRFQIGDERASFIKPSYWDGERRGLLSGEELYLDLKRMEQAFLQQDRREYELTKHVSLLQLNPRALIALRSGGSCEFELPEWLFDLDFPGHYYRRIKSVAVTLPCVTGPYTSVSGTLTQLGSKVRVRATGDGEGSFVVDPVPIQSIAISGAQNDSGLFELNFHDERYLPFEGAGVFGRWRCRLPTEFRPFDYETIADLVLHIRYTAREGGDPLAQRRKAALRDALKGTVGGPPLARLFSLRHEFPSVWQQLMSADAGERAASFAITQDRFSLLLRGRKITVKQVELVTVASADNAAEVELRSPAGDIALSDLPELGAGRMRSKRSDGDLNVMVKDVVGAASWQLKLTSGQQLSVLEDILLLLYFAVE